MLATTVVGFRDMQRLVNVADEMREDKDRELLVILWRVRVSEHLPIPSDLRRRTVPGGTD